MVHEVLGILSFLGKKYDIFFVVIYDTKKISYFLPKKDKIPNTSGSNLVYEFTCPGCRYSCIYKLAFYTIAFWLKARQSW